MLLINNQSELNKACSLLSLESLIGIDTEFERKYHYFARLSTIQIVSENFKFIIDCLSTPNKKLDLAPFGNIIFDDKILKIFHSPRQDLEIFYQIFNDIPKAIFDTQIAANVCGYGQTVSYGNLCEMILSQNIDKKYQTADWMKRPLSQDMLEYALMDAKYLIPLYHRLNAMIKEMKLEDAYHTKALEILNLRHFQPNNEEIWKKVKFSKYSHHFNEKMRIIAGFREECAQSSNMPRKHFATDGDLITICRALPTTGEALNRLNLEKHHISKPQYRYKLLEICTKLKTNKF